MEVKLNGYKHVLHNVNITDESLKVKIADSFVKYNKFAYTSGNGEARLYVGNFDKAKVFFGDKFFESKENVIAFILKDDLLYYLMSAEIEYKQPENEYRNIIDMIDRYEDYMKRIENSEELLYFDICPHIGKKDNKRFYIDSYIDNTKKRSEPFEFLREMLLPQITDVQIIKVYDYDMNKNIFWFRPFLSEFTRLNHPNVVKEKEEEINNDENLKSAEKIAIIRSRLGQGEFRKKCLEKYSNMCLLSQLDQTEILEACHIKPWIDCNYKEALDETNSILLTPTLHKLFDLGFITFNDDLKIILSNFITAQTKNMLSKYIDWSWDELSLSKDYLKYHRTNSFKY